MWLGWDALALTVVEGARSSRIFPSPSVNNGSFVYHEGPRHGWRRSAVEALTEMSKSTAAIFAGHTEQGIIERVRGTRTPRSIRRRGGASARDTGGCSRRTSLNVDLQRCGCGERPTRAIYGSVRASHCRQQKAEFQDLNLSTARTRPNGGACSSTR